MEGGDMKGGGDDSRYL